MILLARLKSRSQVEAIVHGASKVLFAAEVPFRGLYRCMPEQELNLLKLTAAIVAQLRAGPPLMPHAA